jgi:universal stress protein A
MTIYKHILLAVDFSEDTNYLVKRTTEIASLNKAKISVIHVLDNIPMPDMSYGTIIPLDYETEQKLLEIEKSTLTKIGEQLNAPDEQRWLIWGNPQDEVCALAQKEAVDLIIVGSHGRHGLALLLGSTANGVLHHAPCDVLAIRLQK